MITLYKQASNGKLLYAEYWIEEDQVVEHIGEVGTVGTTTRMDFPASFSDEDEFKVDFLHRCSDQGYKRRRGLHADYSISDEESYRQQT
ncbi:hypothetical protein [Paenibacillus illinoisensis]|uniref:hypothetical protein n=1 Tax=Paenibacillus illinoisensis TaxID=59845 RepID=UPI003015AF89